MPSVRFSINGAYAFQIGAEPIRPGADGFLIELAKGELLVGHHSPACFGEYAERQIFDKRSICFSKRKAHRARIHLLGHHPLPIGAHRRLECRVLRLADRVNNVVDTYRTSVMKGET